MPPNTTSGEITVPYALLEQLNASIKALGVKVDGVLQEVQRDKVDLVGRLGDGNTKMSLLSEQCKMNTERILILEQVNRSADPIHIKHSVDALSEVLKQANLSGMSQTMASLNSIIQQVNLPSMALTVERLRSKEDETSNSRHQLAAVQATVASMTEKKPPHWAVQTAGTAAVATLIGMLLNAWVVLPSMKAQVQAQAQAPAPVAATKGP